MITTPLSTLAAAAASPSTNATSDFDLAKSMSDVQNWFTNFIETRQDIFIPCLIVIGIALIAHFVVGWALRRYSKRLSKGGFNWTVIIASSLSAPAGLAIWVIAATMVIRMLLAPDPQQAEVAIYTARIGQIRLGLILILFAWFLVRTVRRMEVKLAEHAKESDRLDLTAVHAVANFVVVFIWLMTILIAAQSYGMNMSAILTLGGASAFALSFAFQDVFKNLFGGVMILFSRPFRVGDSVTLSGKSLSGSIERIGIYQTVMRGWDHIPIVIPNSMFLTNPIMNVSQITQRKISFNIGIRYQDFDQIQPIVNDIKSCLEAHDKVDENALLRVVFNNYGDSSLDMTITFNTQPGASGGDAAAIQEELMIKVGEIVSRHGADFPFPTQTLDLTGPIEIKNAGS